MDQTSQQAALASQLDPVGAGLSHQSLSPLRHVPSRHSQTSLIVSLGEDSYQKTSIGPFTPTPRYEESRPHHTKDSPEKGRPGRG